MKSKKVNDQLAKKTLMVSEHYIFMSKFVEQLRSITNVVVDLRKKADKKGLEVIESHMQDALYSLIAAYSTISPIFTGIKQPEEK
jgi:hypothetical protein